MLKTTLLKAVEAGAVELRRYFNNEDLAISNKEGINNWVTEADHASEKAIIEAIQSDFPDHFILSEESGETATASEIKWIIDPIDGTINYASGIPICAVSIGVEKKGEMIFGAVYNPFINELFLAEKGMGPSRARAPAASRARSAWPRTGPKRRSRAARSARSRSRSRSPSRRRSSTSASAWSSSGCASCAWSMPSATRWST